MSGSRVAIITGAAQGLGLAIAQRLSRDGFHIAINDIPAKANEIENVVQSITNKGRRAIGVPADISSEDGVKSMIHQTVSALGKVDVVSA